MPKPFSWSFSRLKNFEDCPKKHYEIDVAKNFREEVKPGSPLDWGDRVHNAFKDALSKGTPLPEQMKDYQTWVDRVMSMPGDLYVEQKYAINREFKPTDYFAKDVWYRGIADVLRVMGTYAWVGDWKTGGVKPNSVQLMLMAQCIFSHFPDVQKVRTSFVWLGEDDMTHRLLDRTEVANEWLELMPRVKALENAYNTMNYPPKRSGLCKKWCIVKSCPFHGKGNEG